MRVNRPAKRTVRTVIARERSGSKKTTVKRKAGLTSSNFVQPIPPKADWVVLKSDQSSAGTVRFSFSGDPAPNYWTLVPGEVSPAIGLGNGVTLKMRTLSGVADVLFIFY